MGLLDFFSRSSGKRPDVGERVQSLVDELARLSDEEVRRRVERLLRDPDRARVDRTPPTGDETRRVHALPPLLGRLLLEHAFVRLGSGLCIERSVVRPAESAPGATLIGHDGDWADVVVFPSDDRLFRVDLTYPDPGPVEEFRTVYHALLFDASVVDPGRTTLLYGDGG